MSYICLNLYLHLILHLHKVKKKNTWNKFFVILFFISFFKISLSVEEKNIKGCKKHIIIKVNNLRLCFTTNLPIIPLQLLVGRVADLIQNSHSGIIEKEPILTFAQDKYTRKMK